MKPANLPHVRYLADEVATFGEALCPKCLGLGAVVLMHGPAGPAIVDTCPICQGQQVLPRRNGPADLMPAHIGIRTR